MDDDDALLENSRQAWERLKGGGKRTWDDWMVLAKGAHRAVSKGLNQTGLNTPNGRAWSKHFGPVLRANPWLAEIHPTIRSRLMDCWENREAIETWLDGLDPKERIRLNHPTNVLAKWQKEFGLVEPKPKKKSAAEEQQEANLELHDQLDALFGKLEVDNFDRAKEQLDRLIKEGAIIQVAAEPELAKEFTRLKGELSVAKHNLHTATRGLNSTTGELEKTQQQREKQAVTLTRAIELLKALATSYHPHPELVEQAKAFVVELFPDFKPAEAEVASGREPRDTALRADASPQGGSGGRSPTADPNINKNEPTPAEMPRRAIADTEIVWVTNPAGAERVFCTEDGARHDLATNYPDKTGIMVHKQAGENFDLGGQVYSTRFTRAKRVKGEAVANVKMVIEEIKEQQNARKELRATTDADLADRIVVWLRSYSARDDGTPILIQSYLRGHGVWATLAKIKEIIRLNEPKRRGRKPGWRKQVAAAVE